MRSSLKRPESLTLLLPLVLAAAACSGPSAEPDAGTAADAGPPPVVSCDSPEDCRTAGLDAACRAGVCKAQVPCGDDSECALGETCEGGQCRFTGCVEDGDCTVGRCRTDVYACTECASSEQCPAALPVCTDDGRCIQCSDDAQCPAFGPPYCNPTGACVHCLEDAQCPNGLRCGGDGICYGAQKNQFCSEAVACDLGLTCVTVGGSRTVCAEACNLFTPTCSSGEICIKLTFADSAALVFDQGAPLGVCFPPVSGAKGYHEDCTAAVCQPNLECVPDSATRSTCKTYCDPEAPFCAPGEICHPFPGDWSGRQYGLCYPDNGYHDRCESDADCRTGLHCVPDDDPAGSDAVGMFCAFAEGSATALSPCTADADCGSGACRADPEFGGVPNFCFGACRDDADCSVNGREGICDADFLFSTEYAIDARVRGCRTLCGGPADCADYGAASGDFVCVAEPDGKRGSFAGRCSPPQGAALAGQSCLNDQDCRDGYCLHFDGRAVFRDGVCTHPCESGAECGALACEQRSIFAGSGSDGQLNTADDLLARGGLCGAGACASDADCSAPLSECTVDRDPQNPTGNLITACRAPTWGVKQAGEDCTSDSECASGACADLVSPSTGNGRTCLEPCTVGATTCAGGLTCRADAVRLTRPDGSTQTFTACVP